MKEKDRWTAIALAFLLGGLGVHRFYLGQTGYGLLYLLFCWTFVPTAISVIDAIIWAVQDDNTFNRKYNGFVSGRGD
ncbi:MAG: TM2 domain-containing protein [Chitinophagales bacterium]|nr:TM2 domain-containing protein [Chitinophagales bacterium]MCB9021015.1 TM2 domain-containing protein [Chitinophagales bacterium]HPR29249.1 TM2 domain-containing protein [Chitinophagales bacterium]HQU40757.1 TM2 domain-containing protein [Chitinophagales bacterium]HQU77457.1 TM2 domain-containing protein [Chitinophagales bacterium]